MHKRMAMICTALAALAALGILTTAEAAPYPQERALYLDQLEEDPEKMYEVLTKLNRYLQQQDNEKRGGFGLDFGLNRGFSGAQAAKHLMGMAAANYAGGPGRRRRSDQA
ncbi:diuretic hormone class 2 [Fopius arisanus]|uniref:Diuretic hormone class 2 n=2 Tax=Fopius arisanus TaxID=64838 RepID=A0A9R1THT4_9HYME|nr:PREDICTED: diuretic hormone class 2 [Fopius arisanus]